MQIRFTLSNMQTPNILVLNFHGLGSPPPCIESAEAKVWVSKDFFTQVLDRIRGVPWVRITFDDGNDSDYEVALPELSSRGLTAEFFVLAGRLNQPGYLADSQVRALIDSGMGIGSHGMDHRAWPSCDDASIGAEIVEAKSRLERASGKSITAASCPFGQYDRRTLGALRSAGFGRVYTSDRGLAREGEWLQRRNTLRASDTLEDVEKLLRMSPGSLRGYSDRVRTWLKTRR